MVNLLITLRCNHSCSYCFAKEKMHSYSSMDITIKNLDKVLDFLVRSRCSVLQLAGGEPTIHPRFDEILIRTLRRGIYVNLLSNALWSYEKNKFFSKISPTKLGFLLNIDHPDTYRPGEWERVEDNLSALCRRGNATLSFNIFEREPKCEYIFDLVSMYGFKKLRLSFSMPVVFGKVRNIYPPIEDYKALAPFVIDFVKKAEGLGVSVRMDNTVPICMFSKDELGELLLKRVLNSSNFICFPAIDVGPDLSLWRCFGTSGLFNRRLEEFNSLNEVYEYYERVFRPFKVKVYPMDKCYECKYAKEGLCQGGCIGFSIAKCMELSNYPQEIAIEDILDMKPKLPKNMTMRKYEIPRETLVLLLENGDIMEVHPLMKHILDSFDGKRTIREVVEMCMHEIVGVTACWGGIKLPLDAFLTRIASEEVVPIIRKLLAREFIILPEKG